MVIKEFFRAHFSETGVDSLAGALLESAAMSSTSTREGPPPIATAAKPPGRVRLACYRLAAIFIAVTVACTIGKVGLRLLGYTRSYINPGGSFHEPHALVGSRGKPNFSGRFRQQDFDVMIYHERLGLSPPGSLSRPAQAD